MIWKTNVRKVKKNKKTVKLVVSLSETQTFYCEDGGHLGKDMHQ